ncbi:MAG: hypothetical protein IKG56_04640 [Clostridia bacterium]|nr:hypothetical protein [Clostridia bacterium]
MNILDLNIEQYIPTIIDVYTEILGEEYREIIAERLLNARYMSYTTGRGVREYCYFLRTCKERELGLKFLREIGVQSEEEQQISCAEPYSEKSRELLLEYLGSSFTVVGFWEEEYSVSGIKSFDDERIEIARKKQEENENDHLLEYIRISQINMINYLRGSDEINEDNFDDFSKTEEYEQIRELCKEYMEVYKRLHEEYDEFEKTLKPLKDFTEGENKELTEVSNRYGDERREKHDEVMREYTSARGEYREKASTLTDDRDKEILLLCYLENKIAVQLLFESKNPMLVFSIRNQYDVPVADYLLLHEMFHLIGTTVRDNPRSDTTQGEKTVEGIRLDLLPDYSVTSGFDGVLDLNANRYNPRYRKYERLNETITDIFAVEARKRLHERGVFLLEDDRLLTDDLQNANTSFVLKTMLQPLLQNYREEVIKSIITGDRTILTDKVGEGNFEELNDCINAVDAILSGSIPGKDDENLVRIMLVRQKQRCEEIYIKMENRAKKDKDNGMEL